MAKLSFIATLFLTFSTMVFAKQVPVYEQLICEREDGVLFTLIYDRKSKALSEFKEDINDFNASFYKNGMPEELEISDVFLLKVINLEAASVEELYSETYYGYVPQIEALEGSLMERGEKDKVVASSKLEQANSAQVKTDEIWFLPKDKLTAFKKSDVNLFSFKGAGRGSWLGLFRDPNNPSIYIKYFIGDFECKQIDVQY